MRGMEGEETYSASEAAKILRISKRRAQQMASAGEIEATQNKRGEWRISQRSVHERLPGRPLRPRQGIDEGPSESPLEASESFRDMLDRIALLERELGRSEVRLELTGRTESSLREDLERERQGRERERGQTEEEVRRLREELEAERSKGFWKKLFGG